MSCWGAAFGQQCTVLMELYGRIKYVLVFFADAIILPSACYPLIVVQDSLGPQFKKKTKFLLP